MTACRNIRKERMPGTEGAGWQKLGYHNYKIGSFGLGLKRDILWRVYLCFIGITLLCIWIFGKAFYIQRVQGDYWRALSDSLHQKFVSLSADRGTVYSEDKSMLSTSVPYFNIYIDFEADGLREKNGKRFRENLDSLSYCLSKLFRDRSALAYRRDLMQGYRSKDRYFFLQNNLSFEQYKQLRNFPLVRQGKNRSGFIAEINSRRLNPFGLLANRTIGLARINSQNVGLERTYDSSLKGENGSRLVRYMAAGTYVPVEGYEIEPENGKDIVTTIDVNIQDIAENALLEALDQHEADHGTCIVMEVATGKIKAIANLGKQPDGKYWEDLNYAIRASEPGSTFKLATLISLLEDHAVRLTDHVNVEGGVWKVSNRTVRDAEKQEKDDLTVKEAFEHSSNVGMAKLAWSHYASNPGQFVNNLKKLRLNLPTGVDLLGETQPIIKSPKSRTWSATTLPWMAFGYEVLISPLQTLTLYNAVANNGSMMRPFLVSRMELGGRVVRQHEPTVLIDRICSEETLAEIRDCLEGVCREGTAKTAFKDAFYRVAGKTGTSLVANGSRGYADHIYQSSFVGYFPAEQPKYSCIVVIKNKAFAKKYLGAIVAAPVFRKIADKLMSREADQDLNQVAFMHSMIWKKDSTEFEYTGSHEDMTRVMRGLDLNYADSSGTVAWTRMRGENHGAVLRSQPIGKRTMPDLRGMGLRDALYLLESMNLRVASRGTGKVRAQSVGAGNEIIKNQTINLELD
jgi:cell division protein FtsI (penicillin-binding protein 3)